MTSFSWFSGKRESSRKYMAVLRSGRGWGGSGGGGADDPGAFHPADGGPVVLDGVVLGVAVVPDGEAVVRPTPTHLVLRDRRLPDQVVQELAGPWRVVVPEAHVLRGVEVREVRGERVDEQDLLAGLRVGADNGVLGVGEAGVQRVPLLLGHRGAEAGLDAVPGLEAVDLLLDPLGQPPVGLGHVHPDRVAADRGPLHAAQHRPEGRHLPPGGVAVEGVLVVLRLAVQVLVDPDQAGVVRVAAVDRVVLQRPEALGQRDVLAAGDVLVADEEDLVLQEQALELGEQGGVARRLGQADVAQLRADGRRERDDLDVAGAYVERGPRLSLDGVVDDGGHDCFSLLWWGGGGHQDSRTKTEEPTLRPDSRSRWAATASSRA